MNPVVTRNTWLIDVGRYQLSAADADRDVTVDG